MAMASDPLQGPGKNFQELTGQILDTPEGAEDPDTIMHLPSRPLPSAEAQETSDLFPGINIVPAQGSAGATPVSKPADPKPAQRESADASDEDPVDDAMSSGPIHIHEADEDAPQADASQTDAAKAEAAEPTAEDAGATASTEADKPADVKAVPTPASSSKPSPASASASSGGLSGLLSNLIPDFNFGDGPASALPSPESTTTDAAGSKGSSVQPLAGLPGPHSSTFSLDDLFNGPSHSSKSTSSPAATKSSATTGSTTAQSKPSSAPAPAQKGGASTIAVTKPAGKLPTATSALPTAATGGAGALPSAKPAVVTSQEPMVSPELQAIENMEEQALGKATPAAAKSAEVGASSGEIPTAKSPLPASATSGAAAAGTQGASPVSPAAAVPAKTEPKISSELQEIEEEQKEELSEAAAAVRSGPPSSLAPPCILPQSARPSTLPLLFALHAHSNQQSQAAPSPLHRRWIATPGLPPPERPSFSSSTYRHSQPSPARPQDRHSQTLPCWTWGIGL